MKLSIITINYNNAVGLRKTIDSVASQTYVNFEYIVIDGASTDESVNIIEEYAHKIDYWVSEPDKGIYNAMNKGIRMAKGEYIQFLNSGDWLVDEFVVENMLLNIEYNTEILVGNVIFIRPDGKVRYVKNETEISALTFFRGTIQHTSAYIKKSLFDKYGLYDETLRIVSDWKWYLVTVALNNVIVHFSDVYVTYFDTTGISSINKELDKKERRAVIEEFYPQSFLADYDNYYLAIDQYKRLKKYPLFFKLYWLTERILFKLETWHTIVFCWKKNIK